MPGCYCAIELEDARPHSIFNKLEGRATPEWGRRLEHGFGQLVDWFFAFDDHKNSAGFARHFDFGHIEFSGMLVIGRSADLSDHDRTRLRWRSERVTINTHRIYCQTYDELYDDLTGDWRMMPFPGSHGSEGRIVGCESFDSRSCFRAAETTVRQVVASCHPGAAWGGSQ